MVSKISISNKFTCDADPAGQGVTFGNKSCIRLQIYLVFFRRTCKNIIWEGYFFFFLPQRDKIELLGDTLKPEVRLPVLNHFLLGLFMAGKMFLWDLLYCQYTGTLKLEMCHAVPGKFLLMAQGSRNILGAFVFCL